MAQPPKPTWTGRGRSVHKATKNAVKAAKKTGTVPLTLRVLDTHVEIRNPITEYVVQVVQV